MSQPRDVAAFDDRAPGYEQGWLGRLHHEIAQRTAALTQATDCDPGRVLDVGCGTGYLLRLLMERYAESTELNGVDPAPNMIEAASAIATDGRINFSVGVAEHIPYSAGAFDLVVSTTSFDHWADQPAGLLECSRVLAPDGHLVLVDQFSLWLLPTLLGSRWAKARTRGRANRLLREAGFKSVTWHPINAAIIQAVTATR
ncbi:MAG: class I SAM-dependent methyltransferase [Acidimicrobiales bacterium]